MKPRTMMLLAALVAAVVADAQETDARRELPESEIAGTIESNDRELLEHFVDWLSVLPRVRTDFEEQDHLEMPAEFGEWAVKALQGVEQRNNRVVIPRADAPGDEAKVFASMVYQVFYDGPYRDWCMQRVADEMAELERDAARAELDAMGVDPRESLQRLAELRDQSFALEMERAEAEARATALSQRIEEQKSANAGRDNSVADTAARYREMAAVQREELDRLRRMKEKLGTNETRDIEAAQLKLMQAEAEIAARMDELRAREDRANQGLSKLREMLIDAETDFVGIETRMRVLNERFAAYEQRAELARELMEREFELESRHHELERTMERLHTGRLFGLSGIPTLKFR